MPLGVGTVLEIFNLVQATDKDGVALFVAANGKTVTNPPENLVRWLLLPAISTKGN